MDMDIKKLDVEGCVRKTPEQLKRAIVNNDARDLIGKAGEQFLAGLESSELGGYDHEKQ